MQNRFMYTIQNFNSSELYTITKEIFKMKENRNYFRSTEILATVLDHPSTLEVFRAKRVWLEFTAGVSTDGRSKDRHQRSSAWIGFGSQKLGSAGDVSGRTRCRYHSIELI